MAQFVHIANIFVGSAATQRGKADRCNALNILWLQLALSLGRKLSGLRDPKAVVGLFICPYTRKNEAGEICDLSQ
jgi:hypothetical protein